MDYEESWGVGYGQMWQDISRFFKAFTFDEAVFLLALFGEKYKIYKTQDRRDLLEEENYVYKVKEIIVAKERERLAADLKCFHMSQKEITNQTGIPENRQRKIVKNLKQLGVISVKRKGIPALNYYILNINVIYKTLSEVPHI